VRRAEVDGAEAATVPAGPWMRMMPKLDSASAILTVWMHRRPIVVKAW
jgi:hypothetical protein